MTNPLGPSKEFVLKAAKTVSGFVQDHMGVSGKATTEEVVFTLRIRRRPRRKGPP